MSNRNSKCLIVDEVDSMLLDKAENMLYLSHNFNELKHLRSIFALIWNFVNGKEFNVE